MKILKEQCTQKWLVFFLLWNTNRRCWQNSPYNFYTMFQYFCSHKLLVFTWSAIWCI